MELVITAEGLDNYDNIRIFDVLDASSNPIAQFNLNQSSGLLYFRIKMYRDGSAGTWYDTLGNISLNTRYRLEFKFDPTNDTWAWRLDGVDQPNDQDDTDPVTSEGTLLTGHAAGARKITLGGYSDALTFTIYYDLIAVDNAAWVGEESAGTTINLAAQIDLQSAAGAIDANVARDLSAGMNPAAASSAAGLSVSRALNSQIHLQSNTASGIALLVSRALAAQIDGLSISSDISLIIEGFIEFTASIDISAETASISLPVVRDLDGQCDGATNASIAAALISRLLSAQINPLAVTSTPAADVLRQLQAEVDMFSISDAISLVIGSLGLPINPTSVSMSKQYASQSVSKKYTSVSI